MSEQNPQSRSSSRGWKRTLVLILAAVCVLAVVGAGAFAFGRSSAKRAVASGKPVGTTVLLSNGYGSSIQVTLDRVIDPDQADFGRPSNGGCGNGRTSVPVAVVMRFVNDGSTVLAIGGLGDDLALVGSSVTPFFFPANECLDTSQNAAPACLSSVSEMDLAPGASATWCPVIYVSVGDILNEIRFDAANVLGWDGAFVNGKRLVATWNVP